MIRIDASGWAKRNLWPLPSGELAVRPGLREELDGSSSLSGREIDDGFSVIDPVTGDAWFYIVHHATSGAADVQIDIYDHNFTLFQRYSTGSDAVPEVVTHAEVLDSIVISSPSFPTAFGLVGGGLIKAEKQDSVNSFLTALDVPAGICTAWASSRVVIARGSSLFVSDPVTATGGDPRTFVAENQIHLEAPIYGLHTTAGGSLVACTSRGVYALSEQAAASGQVPVGDWRRLSDHEATRYKTTAAVNGRLWGLTRKGIHLIDVEGAQEVPLDDPDMDGVDIPIIKNHDYRRNAILLAGPDGPMVALHTAGALMMIDEHTGVRSWWTGADDNPRMEVVGVGTHAPGDTVLICSVYEGVTGSASAVLRVTGNEDCDEQLRTSTDTGTGVTGYLLGRQPSPVDGSPVIRQAFTAVDGSLATCRIRGASSSVTVAHPYDVGTATWSATPTTEDPEIRSARHHFAERTDDFGFIIGAYPQLTRISTEIAVEIRGPGRRGRP